MITRNLHNYLMQRLSYSDLVFKNRSGSEYTWPGSKLGNWTQISAVSASFGANHSTTGQPCRTVRIGSGTTEPTYDDYDLESIIDAAPKTINMAYKNTYDANYNIVSASFLNETDSDWIVTEVGMYVPSLNMTAETALLLAREVFDPVTVKPGQTFSVSMKLF